ncbi:bifunctional methylenetetrahydrofolate dehydrogenase/methenyltetrahydrofolate cyclohydrolase FolD [Paraburkholderia caballeronis]|uniref:Bifunctional protein FolD n=1 Tax=Paraburkholderia caballeronis TaxID=416943 RepID=A0A1H7VMW8_9BURK|nr:bifunctional methylenetetrahydrofolate dehydrogenase/methenyltetrahydrofolate cyclohydrolase FolD [Paraburkholderia caballeronis]PXW14987.1 methenyltetrahydrofolate cyclohydrolase /5,10-methylenetetrahydrofolate dehydrogenase (NADP+) [Paraburkholderia caballeronis]PXW93620.1 methenyltetrahydrofolate cyclohydrolase /5,10-methylenetetrahydrofolate dehydrogenase (NADP+) [Paraburkholderia caballeronis]RAJ88951.1 methenyltetrahydrofolate cyclohydrolase /5,10-methylenetetrahydrofolate dehydrogenase
MSAAQRIDGKAEAARVLDSLRDDVERLREQGCAPCLAVVLVGDDPASDVYVRNKVLRARETGIESVEHRLPANTSEDTLLTLIAALNADPAVHGILVQMPLPAGLDEHAVIDAIAPAKDVDGFHPANVGQLVLGDATLAPCTPNGCLHLLRQVAGDLSGKHAVVVGRSNIVGKPMAALLLQANCSVTVVHSRSTNAAALCRQADIVVAAVGRPRLLDAGWIKPGAIVIDVGINRIEIDGQPKLVGDVDFDSVAPVAGAITPVPGGVGPMTIAFLMKNTIAAAVRQQAMRDAIAA